jgi:putative two-component system response regulator
MALAVGGAAVLLAIGLVSYIITLLIRFFERIRADAELLEQRVHDVEEARLETLERLALAAEYRDDDTLRHTERVGRCAALVAERMSLAPETVEEIRLAAPLHDIGKLGVSDTILLKPGRLTPEERESMQRHSAIGAAILAGSESPVLKMAQEIALSHHERWDGGGYPAGLAGKVIPLPARIVALADVFDALTHERPYKHAWPLQKALDEVEGLSGQHFDPAVAAAFFSLGDELIADVVVESGSSDDTEVLSQPSSAALALAAA